MKLFKKNGWVALYVAVFAILAIIAFNVTPDNLYNPSWEVYNHKVKVDKTVTVNEATEIYYINLRSYDEKLDTLLFYTNHQEVYVYSNENLIYSLKSADSVFGRTPGAMWNKVGLTSDMERLEIIVTQVYPDQTKQIPEFELGNSNNIYREVVSGAAMELILAGAIVVIGFAFFVMVLRMSSCVTNQESLEKITLV